MVVNFSSMEFLFRFLPVFLILYFIVPRKYRELTLLVGSFVFYALGDLKFLPVLALLILLNYALASASWKQQEGYSIQEWQQQKRKRYLTMQFFWMRAHFFFLSVWEYLYRKHCFLWGSVFTFLK